MGKRRTRRRDTRKEEVWRQRMTQWNGSGLSVREFCRQWRLSEASFYAWRRELARRDAQGSQAEPAQADTQAAGPRWEPVVVAGSWRTGGVEATLPGGVQLRVAPGFDPQTLREVVEVLWAVGAERAGEAEPC